MFIIRWAAADQPDVIRVKASVAANLDGSRFTEPVVYINPAVLMAAFDDHTRMLEQDPEGCQAMLNGCLEAYRGSEKITGANLAMMGTLMSSGFPETEVLIRVLANSLFLGMLLERRVSGG
jgi:hypothetical protein